MYLTRYAYLVVLALLLAVAGFIRFWAAPLSAGPDVAQFWAFAKVFHDHGLDFYRYADGNLDIFPYKGWGFLYPPLWLLLLGLALMFVPLSVATELVLDPGWRFAMKTPIILADLVIGMLLYWAVPGSRTRKLVFASLWLFHPTAWYQSAVFGQFDSIAAAFLLASVITLMRGKDKLAFLLAGLAIMTKQHVLISVGLMFIITARYVTGRRLLTNGLIVVGVVFLLSLPFLLTGNVWSYARSVLLPGAAPDYQGPLVFVLGGTGSFFSFLHEIFGWETRFLLILTLPLVIIALVIVAVLSYQRAITFVQGALVGFLVFIALYYRINYQYLIVYIPLALLLAAQTPYRSEKILALALAFVPVPWLWLTGVTMWFSAYEPTDRWVEPILSRLGLLDRIVPDYAYVALAMVIMCLSLVFVVLVFVRWRHEARNPFTPRVEFGG